MSNYKDEFIIAGAELGLTLEELPLEIHLKNMEPLLGAFIERETDTLLAVNVTRPDFCEEFHVIPKTMIEYIKIQYETMITEEYDDDCRRLYQ